MGGNPAVLVAFPTLYREKVTTARNLDKLGSCLLEKQTKRERERVLWRHTKAQGRGILKLTTKAKYDYMHGKVMWLEV